MNNVHLLVNLLSDWNCTSAVAIRHIDTLVQQERAAWGWLIYHAHDTAYRAPLAWRYDSEGELDDDRFINMRAVAFALPALAVVKPVPRNEPTLRHYHGRTYR